MTIKNYNAGSLSLSEIQSEFGGNSPIGLSEYYAGGSYVSANTLGFPGGVSTGIPTSGAISIGNFYGAARYSTFYITIASDTQNYTLNTANVAGYIAGKSLVILTINLGVVVSSQSTGWYAFDVDTSWNANDIIIINNNGSILGMGGNGGHGALPYNYSEAGDGTSGGPAVRAQRAITFNNAGTVGGGGGGGGGGSAYWEGLTYITAHGGGGGGGGAGRYAGSGGPSGGTAGSESGSAGTDFVGGGGGQALTYDFFSALGGSAGGLGEDGSPIPRYLDSYGFGTQGHINVTYYSWSGTGGYGGAALSGKGNVNAGVGIVGAVFGGQG